jgi:hypothetical protein
MIMQQHVQYYLIGVADASEVAADFIPKVQKMMAMSLWSG